MAPPTDPETPILLYLDEARISKRREFQLLTVGLRRIFSCEFHDINDVNNDKKQQF